MVEKRREATKKSYAFQVKATDWYNVLTERKKRLLIRNMEVVLLKRRTQPRRCSSEKLVLNNIQKYTEENTCARVSISIKLTADVCNFIKKDTLTQVFSYDLCKKF